MKLLFTAAILVLFNQQVISQGTKSFDSTNVRYKWDIFYTEARDSLQSVDVYWNSKSKNSNVLMFVHGGGWLSGDKKQYREMASNLAAYGLTVVLVNYRLSPLVKFPSHTDDVVSAISWTNKFINRYYGNKKKIYLMGHSAGGHIISLIALDDKYLKKYKLKPTDIRGVMTIDAVFEIKPQEGGATKKYLGMVFGDDENIWNQASCKNYIKGKSMGKTIPPFLISWGKQGNELIIKESQNIIKEFGENGIKMQTYIFETKDHYAFVDELKDNKSPFLEKIIGFMGNDD